MSKLPDDHDSIIQLWQDGMIPHGRMAPWISRQLGEMLNDEEPIDVLKEIAREVAEHLGSTTSVPGFEIDPGTSYTQKTADLKALLACRDTIEGFGEAGERIWQMLEQRVIKEKIVSRRGSVRFVASKKAREKEQRRQEKIKHMMEGS